MSATVVIEIIEIIPSHLGRIIQALWIRGVQLLVLVANIIDVPDSESRYSGLYGWLL